MATEMIEKILNCEKECDIRLKNAQSDAQSILDNAKAQAQTVLSDAENKAKEDYEKALSQCESENNELMNIKQQQAVIDAENITVEANKKKDLCIDVVVKEIII